LIDTRLKIFDYSGCLSLKNKGYCFFIANYLAINNEEHIIFHPFKDEENALFFSKNTITTDSSLIPLNEELINLPSILSKVNIYIEMP
jgi:hypothetical protein